MKLNNMTSRSIICPSVEEITDCARSWLGTRFLHQGRLKKTTIHKGGVDCLGLLIGVSKELQLTDKHGGSLANHDNTQYTRTPDTSLLRHMLQTLLAPKPIDQLAPGDVALFTLQDNPQHLAIITDGVRGSLNIIHAYAQARKVVEHELDNFWRKSLVAGYQIRS